MHLVQFPLKIINLFFDRRLPVKLFLAVFLRILRLLGDLCNLHELVDRRGDHGVSCPPGIRGKYFVFLLCIQVQIIGKGTGKVMDIFALQDKTARPESPLITLDKTQKRSAELRKLPGCFFFGQIVRFGTQCDGRGKPSVLV